VQSVVTHAGKIIPRQAFAQYRAQDIPDGFDTQHASINKAGARLALLHTELQLVREWLSSFEPTPAGPREANISSTGEFLSVRNFPLPDAYNPDYIDLVLYVENYPSVPPIGIYLLNDEIFRDCLTQISHRIHSFDRNAFHGAEPPLPGYRWLCLVTENWSVNLREPRKGQNLMKYLGYFYGLLNE
jgi:hypothetical protein